MTTPVVVLTVDQRGSRTSPDRIPEMLAGLAAVPARLGFERTVGDELQGVLDDGTAVADTVE
ncbi:transposase, partial [Nocardioides hankookensis]